MLEQAHLKQLREEEKMLDAHVKSLPATPLVYAITAEAKPPVIRVQRRGDPEDPQQEVTPGAFAWAKHARADFGDNDTPEGQRRIALARMDHAS